MRVRMILRMTLHAFFPKTFAWGYNVASFRMEVTLVSRNIRSAALVLVAILALTSVAVSATKKKPAPKRVVLGTTQSKGTDNCKIGLTYTLDKSNPINVTINSVEYSVDPIAIGNTPVTHRRAFVYDLSEVK